MASCVVTKKKVYWSDKTDSHEIIIKENGLKELDARGNATLVRVELIPNNEDYRLPIKSWVYKIEQDILPNWYDAKEVERRSRVALKDWYKACVIPVGKVVYKLNRSIKLVLGTVNEVLGGGTVNEVLGGGTVNKVWGGGTVNEVLGGGTVNKVLGGGTVNEVWGGGTVNEVWGGGTVNKVWGGGTVNKVWGGGTVNKVWGGGTVNKVLGGGTVNEVWGGGTVNKVLGGGTVNEVWGGTVITYTSLPLTILKGVGAVIVDRSGKIVVCHVGK